MDEDEGASWFVGSHLKPEAPSPNSGGPPDSGSSPLKSEEPLYLDDISVLGKIQQPTQQVEEEHGRQYSTAQSRGVGTAGVHRSRPHRTGASQVRVVPRSSSSWARS